VAPSEGVVDPNAGNDSAETTVTVRRDGSRGDHKVYLPLVIG
jgi:hypothetical protein